MNPYVVKVDFPNLEKATILAEKAKTLYEELSLVIEEINSLKLQLVITHPEES